MSTSDIEVETWLRGYHIYRDIWKNIDRDQEVFLKKQPNNQFDKNAIGGYVKSLNPEDETLLTEIGHLPRNFSRALKKINGEEVLSFKCRVADKKAVRASGLNGLQIRVTITITLTKKKIVMLRKQLAKISDCCLIL